MKKINKRARIRSVVDIVYDKLLPFGIFQKHKRVFLYLAFGGFASIVDLVIYLVLFNYFNVDPVVSTFISIGIATIVGFFLNAVVNFGVEDNLRVRFVSYAIVSGVGLVISATMLYALSELNDYDANWVKVCSLPVIFVIQYFLNSRISFSHHLNERK
jgi:putative flippase GtrA